MPPTTQAKKRKEPSSSSDVPGDAPPLKCTIEDCGNVAQSGGICITHGGKRPHKICTAEGCTSQARRGGVCTKHGAKQNLKRCSKEGCNNFVKKGGLCRRHCPEGARVTDKQCTFAGCDKLAQRGGVCIGHGAEVKLCSVEGCSNKRYKAGVCLGHGAKEASKCHHDGCMNYVVIGLFCRKHREIVPGEENVGGENFGGGNVVGSNMAMAEVLAPHPNDAALPVHAPDEMIVQEANNVGGDEVLVHPEAAAAVEIDPAVEEVVAEVLEPLVQI